MFVEGFDQLGEVGKRARQAIDLVDDDHIHPALPHLGEQTLQGWTVVRGDHIDAGADGVAQRRGAKIGSYDIRALGDAPDEQGLAEISALFWNIARGRDVEEPADAEGGVEAAVWLPVSNMIGAL